MIIIRDTKQLVRELIEVIDRTQRSITTKDLEAAMREAMRECKDVRYPKENVIVKKEDL